MNAVVGEQDEIVLSSSSMSRSPSTNRPIWSSVWSRAQRTPPAAVRRTAAVHRRGLPCLHAGVAGSKRGVGIDHAEFDLAVKPLLTDHVPSGVVATPVLLEVLVGRLMGCVGRSERQVGEERTIRAEALVVVDHQQQLIDQVFGEVVPLRRRGRRIDVSVVTHELGVELIGLAREEAVEALEASGKRPLIERRRTWVPGARYHFPRRVAALVTQDLGHRGGGIGRAQRIRESGTRPARPRMRPRAGSAR